MARRLLVKEEEEEEEEQEEEKKRANSRTVPPHAVSVLSSSFSPFFLLSLVLLGLCRELEANLSTLDFGGDPDSPINTDDCNVPLLVRQLTHVGTVAQSQLSSYVKIIFLLFFFF